MAAAGGAGASTAGSPDGKGDDVANGGRGGRVAPADDPYAATADETTTTAEPVSAGSGPSGVVAEPRDGPSPSTPRDGATEAPDPAPAGSEAGKWAIARARIVPMVRIASRWRVGWQKSLLDAGNRVVPYAPPKQTKPKRARVHRADSAGSRRSGKSSGWIATELQQMMEAAHRGDTEAVQGILANGAVKVDDVLEECEVDSPCRQTAMMKAVRYGHVDTARALLEAGANPLHTDYRQRTAWYYACFSVTMPEGRHADMVALLIEYIPEITPKLLRLACHSPKSVADLALDSIDRRVVTRDSKMRYTVVFTNLHFLDDGTDELVWPDFSKAPPGETALDALVAREAPELTHPAVMGLLNWKVSKFAQRLAQWDLLSYAIWLLAMSSVAVLVAKGGHARGGTPMTLSVYDSEAEGDWGSVRAACEILTVVLSVYQGLHEARDLWLSRKKLDKMSKLTGSMRVSVYWLPVVIGFMRAADVETDVQISMMAVTVVASWLNFVNLLVLIPDLGRFFIMVSVMLRRDIPLFLVVLAVIVPGFSLAFNLLYNNVRELHLADASSRFSVGGLTAGFSSVMVVANMGDWDGGADHASLTFSGLWLVFVLIGPVLALNLLIAMLNNTYSMLQSAVMREWVFRMASYIVRRQNLLDREIAHLDATRDGNKIAIKAKYGDFFVGDYVVNGDVAVAASRMAPAPLQTTAQPRNFGQTVQEVRDAMRRLDSRADMSFRGNGSGAGGLAAGAAASTRSLRARGSAMAPGADRVGLPAVTSFSEIDELLADVDVAPVDTEA